MKVFWSFRKGLSIISIHKEDNLNTLDTYKFPRDSKRNTFANDTLNFPFGLSSVYTLDRQPRCYTADKRTYTSYTKKASAIPTHKTGNPKCAQIASVQQRRQALKLFRRRTAPRSQKPYYTRKTNICHTTGDPNFAQIATVLHKEDKHLPYDGRPQLCTNSNRTTQGRQFS